MWYGVVCSVAQCRVVWSALRIQDLPGLGRTEEAGEYWLQGYCPPPRRNLLFWLFKDEVFMFEALSTL